MIKNIFRKSTFLFEKKALDCMPVNVRIIAHCVAFNQEHFIEAWVRNAVTYADEILVLYSKQPWNYNKEAKDIIKTDNTGYILDRLKDEFKQLLVVEGKWDNETVQRNDAIKIARKREGDILLIVDADEFYEASQVREAYKWMLENPAQVWCMHHIQLIKRVDWSIITPKGHPLFEFAIDLHRVSKFKEKRFPKANERISIPEDICKCWHFSYLMSELKLKEKLASFGHAQEIRPDWLTEVWPNIKPGVKDFHPVHPSAWKEIKTVIVPKSITSLLPWIA